ncbi:MAG: acetylxylan esterase [Verrucomicrobiales bacterium]|nr:acetylxylan esterase [Verrucomicrobiales bacterium]
MNRIKMTLPRWKKLSLSLIVLVAFSTRTGFAQPSATREKGPPGRLLGDVMFEKYLAQETVRLSDRFLDGAKTLEEWKAKRPRLRQEFLNMIGLWPLPEKTPLNATVTGSIEGDDFVVEKLHYQSRPGLYVTANLWRPREVKEKLPGVLLFVGHHNRGRNGHKTFMQDQGKWFARNGYVCLIMDSLTRGELPGEHQGLYSRNRWWWIACGYTPAAVECWNAVRGIDYLVSRPEVGADRIAATGLSGGGAVTFWISAVDDRVKCAAAHSGLTDWESNISNRILRLHCDCMLPYNTYGWEFTTVGALIAPTPFLFANCDDDLGFPMAANRRIAERLRRIYRMYGPEEHFEEYVTHGPLGAHEYTPDSRRAIFKWINQHLKGDASPVTDVEEKRFAEEELRTFPTDKDIPAGVLNNEIDRTFVPLAQVSLPSPGQFTSWRENLLKQLQELSFRTFPERIPPADKAPRPNEYRFVDWEREEGVQVWNTESGVLNYITLHGVLSNEPLRDTPVTLVVVNEGESLSQLPEWAKAFIAEHEPYAILAPRGVGPTAWTPEPANYIQRAHLFVGRTIDQGRVWDIAAVGRHLNGDGPIKVIGRGLAGILGAYAALFEPTIQEVVVVDPPASHAEGPIFLNVLRVLDIPEALGLLAPRPLTLVNANDPVFNRIREIYKRAGAHGRMKIETR